MKAELTVYGLKKLARIVERLKVNDEEIVRFEDEDDYMWAHIKHLCDGSDEGVDKMVEVVEDEHATVFAIGGDALLDVEDLNYEG